MASKRNPADLLMHIKQEIDWAIPYYQGMDLEYFISNMNCIRAAEHAMLIISEAVKNMPADILALHPEIDWRAIRGSGNFLRHEYDVIDRELIWVTVTKRFLDLRPVIESLINKLSANL